MGETLYNLTNPQKSIWDTQEFYSNTPISNIVGTAVVKDKIDFKLFSKAVNIFLEKSDAFRLKIILDNGEPKQFVEAFSPLSFNILEVSSDRDVEKIAKKMADTPFSILNSQLFKFELFRYPDGHGGIILLVHHIVSDAWSCGLFISEIISIYDSLLDGSYEDLAANSYIDYIESEKEYLSSPKFEKDKAFWLEKFETIPEKATIPSSITDNSFSCKAKRKNFKIPSETMDVITSYCKENKVSVFNFFMGIYAIYLSRINSLDDLVIGTPVLNRSNAKEKHTIGMFISVVPFKIHIDPNQHFTDFLRKISSDFFDVFRHQKYPYQKLLEDLRKIHPNLPNLYDVIVSYQNMRSNAQTVNSAYDAKWLFSNNISDDMDIHFFDINDTGTIDVAYDYKISKYSTEDIYNIHARILHIINQILSNSDVLVQDIDIITPDEKSKILYKFNNTKMDYPRDKTIVDLFEEQAEKTPDNTAVVFEDQELTYKELNERANQLAHYLISKGVQQNDTIAIYLNKCIEIVVAMLGILKANCAFLPLDTTYPDERISYMLSNSNAKFICTSVNLLKKVKTFGHSEIDVSLQNSEIYSLNKSNLKPFSCNDNMYIIYTSGSTGKPKGVIVTHRNIVRLVTNQNFITYGNNEVMVQTGTIAFDACIFEIFTPLLHGFKLFILKKERLLDIELFEKFLITNQITILFLTTGLFNEFGNINPLIFRNLKYLLTGGDVISYQAVNKILERNPKLNIINCYGPTENGSYSTCFNIGHNWSNSYIPIGKPIANSTAYIVSKYGNLLPSGYPGELWVGGDGISKGYVGRKDESRFIYSPFNNELIYKTGDLVKYDEYGNICFLGRIDNQVKIRGFRIELNEINTQICKFPGISESITVVKPINGNNQIFSYVISNDEIDIINLKAFLTKLLPTYMIPTNIIQLEKFPLTTNGKIDIKALPASLGNLSTSSSTLPRNKLDDELIDIFKNVLNIETIYLDDNFFDLGGDSLSAINLCAQIKSHFNFNISVKDILENPQIRSIADMLSSNAKNDVLKKEEGIIPHVISDFYPASSAQKRIYLSTISAKNSTNTLYNISGGAIFDGPIDYKKLEKCLEQLIDRHESLRTYFETYNGEIIQKILNSVNFKLDIVENVDFENLNQVFKDFVKPFDLSKAPLFRTLFIRFTNKKCALLIDMHHIISDGASLNIFTDELCKLYNNESLQNLEITYKDFACYEQNLIKTNSFKDAEDFWLSQFAEDIPSLNLPAQFIRPAIKSFEGKKIYSSLNQETISKIDYLSKLLDVTPYMILLGAYYILLYKYTNQNDIIVGSPAFGRDFKETYSLIGMFVNTLALRQNLDSKMSFKDFVLQIKDTLLNSYKYQTYPFDELVNKLKIQRDPSRNPLFDTMFTYQNNGIKDLSFGDVKANYYIPDIGISKFDLSLEIIPKRSGASISFEYSTNLFESEFIENLSTHYLKILDNILSDANIKISNIDMLTTDERNIILNHFNDTKLEYPKDANIVELFEHQVEKTPDNIAVVFENENLTYAELNEKANKFAHFLKSTVQKNSIVPVLMSRKIDLIVSLLAIIKCGGAYLPISLETPVERINYILDNCNANILITDEDQYVLLNENKNINVININSFDFEKYSNKNLNLEIDPLDLLYVIYTSGSTGNPKGVKVCHRNLINFVYSFNKLYGNISDRDRLLASTNISFDVSIFELFMPLLNGFSLYLYDEPYITDIFKYCKTIMKNKITFAYIPPNILEEVYTALSSYSTIPLNKILLGVEPIKSNSIKKYYSLNSDLKIVNAYGPTETTICATGVVIDKSILQNYKILPIGMPLSNLNIFILNKDMQPVPIGVPGEIYIGGDNVTKGYLNNKELTENAFVSIQSLKCARAYKTGDLAKWDDSGLITFIGRNDSQVKINGHRIELGEIENCAQQYPNMDKVVVLVDKSKKIICYFSSSIKINTGDLKAFMQRKLPLYFIPNFFVQVDSFKLTSNGKIDKKYLKNIKLNVSNICVPPKNELQKKLVVAFETILGTSPVSITDNFFELGGDSLLAIKLQIEAFNLGLDIPYQYIFKYPTIEQLSKNISITDSNNINDEYNYEKIDDLLKSNTYNSKEKIVKNKFKNILLTGATGYLGSHILDSLMKNTKCKIYCLVRVKDKNDPQIRLLNTLRFYFGKKYDKEISKRIIVVEGDITEENLGLNADFCNKTAGEIDCVINSAAIVKHYGKSDAFNSTNIQGAKNIIDFCNTYSCKLFHLSTLSVSGNIFETSSYKFANLSKDIVFDESKLYIGQDLSNVYIHTKFIAERLILENILNNKLDAKIIRIGNITNRYSDGIFQINVSENAFLNRLNSFLHIGCIPDYLLDKYVEFSPVDFCAEAIVKLIFANTNVSIYHIYNNNHINFMELVRILNNLNINIKIVDKETFNKKIKALSNDNSTKDTIFGLINDFDENKNLSYNTNIKIQNAITNNFLKKLSFKWPKINEKYIKKYIIYLKSIGYIE